MPIVRSQFNFSQFETVLQKMAHEIAKKAVNTLKSGNCRINISGRGPYRQKPEFTHVETSKYTIRFYAKHASYYEEGGLSFDVEEKLYLVSNHCTKISFWAPDGKVEERQKEVLAFIDKIMADVKIIPRFSLGEYTNDPKEKVNKT